MMPGRRIRVNENSPWPERVGCEGVIVDPAIFNGLYPADSRRSGEVIVLLDEDPLRAKHPDESRWTCVMSTRDVTRLP